VRVLNRICVDELRGIKGRVAGLVINSFFRCNVCSEGMFTSRLCSDIDVLHK
jgi:hypothetical protein